MSQQNETALAAEVEQRRARLTALSVENEELRKETQKKFREKYADRFKDLNVGAALSGHPAQHVAVVGGAKYFLRSPMRQVLHNVEQFCAKPVDTDKNNLGPVSPEEALLLAWLVCVGFESSPAKDLTATPLGDKLVLIRKLPDVLLQKLAEECHYIQAYLNVCLEMDLGNS
jgi:hypothetical protein